MRNKSNFSLNILVFKDIFQLKWSNIDHFRIKIGEFSIVKNRNQNSQKPQEKPQPEERRKNRRGLSKTARFCGFPAGLKVSGEGDGIAQERVESGH